MASEQQQDLTSGVVTRKRAATPLRTSPEATASGPTLEAITLQSALREIRQLREERLQQQADYEAQLQQREEMLRRMEERIRQLDNNDSHSQLSHSYNRDNREGHTERGNFNNRNNDLHTEHGNLNLNECGYKLKPDNFDGSVPLREFFTQFHLIARANGWSNSVKTVVLASCLRGKARSVLDGIFEIEDLKFEELKSRLELRFGEGYLAQTYYTQFTNRKQKDSEDLATLGADLERLSRFAYPECTQEVRDKIACAQFIAALSDGFIKRTLQLENVTSLKLAIERAMVVRVIQENSFYKKKDERNNLKFKNERNKFMYDKNGKNTKKMEERKSSGKESKNFEKSKYFNKARRNFVQNKECWQCGAQGHFRSECPALRSEENKV